MRNPRLFHFLAFSAALFAGVVLGLRVIRRAPVISPLVVLAACVFALILTLLLLVVATRWRPMRLLPFASAISAALMLSGCAEFQNAINYLGSPQATQAAQNVKSLTTSLSCQVASVSVLESQIASYISNNQAAVKDSQTVCVVSSAICSALGGTAAIANCTAPLPGAGAK